MLNHADGMDEKESVYEASGAKNEGVKCDGHNPSTVAFVYTEALGGR